MIRARMNGATRDSPLIAGIGEQHVEKEVSKR
jgi:hypothetical protein